MSQLYSATYELSKHVLYQIVDFVEEKYVGFGDEISIGDGWLLQYKEKRWSKW